MRDTYSQTYYTEDHPHSYGGYGKARIRLPLKPMLKDWEFKKKI